MKLWCSKKTSWAFFFPFFEVLHNYRQQMTGAVRPLFSRASENKMWKACKQDGWGRDKGAAEPLLLGEGENWASFTSRKSAQHTHTQENYWNPSLPATYYYLWPPFISLYGTGCIKVTVSRWWPTKNSGHRAMYCVTFPEEAGESR